MIMKCTCPHVSQDRLHGKGNRVFAGPTKDNMYRCTICSKTKGTGG
ncbi:hypothetical protein LCGC14_0264200 [marine sediment metagenome]|uniref:Uncharacterized protein n=1 Tax=marine sediment metagenome TaxID=412755 RepID=A0A0F9WLF7_9ZZZZ